MESNLTEDLETTSCPLCEDSQSRTAYAWPGPVPYRVLCCRACRFHYLSPRPKAEVMARIYRDDGYYHSQESGGYEDYLGQEPALKRTFAKLMKELQGRGWTGGRLLEIGCGFGYLLQEAAPFFECRQGTDFSPGAVAAASPGADKVYLGGLEQIPKTQKFHMIIANQVIEHVYEPLAFLRNISQRLLPGGRVIITTPDMGSWWRKCMGRRWPSFKLPEHLLYFQRNHLTHALRSSGFAQVVRLPYPHAFPLALVAAKLGLRVPTSLGRLCLWIPSTTLALMGQVAD